MRTVAQAPDGAVYLLIDGDEGSLIRVTKKPLDD
ncbi:MAG: hypothetical protein ACE5NW_19200 [Acidiferrobacterales bacterium]